MFGFICHAVEHAKRGSFSLFSQNYSNLNHSSRRSHTQTGKLEEQNWPL